MTFVSCPPMSITRRSSRPCRKHAPRAWQVISVTLFPAYGTATRPYPVATQGYVSGEKCAALSSARMLSAVSTLLQPVGRAEEQGERPVGGEHRRLCAGGADIDADGVVHAVILPSFFLRLL